MNKNEILVVLTDKWNDWEASYMMAVTNSFTDYSVRTITDDDNEKESMGGLKVKTDYNIDGYNNFDELAMVIISGGLSWEENDYDDIAEFVRKVIDKNIPVAAICGGSLFLCKHGFLNKVKHTGDSVELFKEQEKYTGEKLYVEAQLVVDQGIITANETAAVEFAYNVFKMLKIDSDEEIEEWYDNFKNGAVR